MDNFNFTKFKIRTNFLNNKVLSLILLALILTSPKIFSQDSSSGIGGDGGGPKQSWQDIYKNPNLRPEFPTFLIEGRKVNLNNLCLIGERVRTKYKYLINSPQMTLKLIYDFLETDRVFESEICTKYENQVCSRYEYTKVEIPLKAEIKVLKKVSAEGEQDLWSFSFTKSFELQFCN